MNNAKKNRLLRHAKALTFLGAEGFVTVQNFDEYRAVVILTLYSREFTEVYSENFSTKKAEETATALCELEGVNGAYSMITVNGKAKK